MLHEYYVINCARCISFRPAQRYLIRLYWRLHVHVCHDAEIYSLHSKVRAVALVSVVSIIIWRTSTVGSELDSGNKRMCHNLYYRLNIFWKALLSS